MIEVLQGVLGSGKSAVATAMSMMHLKKGGVVACNFSLVDGWADAVASHNLIARFSPEYRYDLATSLHKRFFRVKSLNAIETIRPKELAIGLNKTKEGRYQEGQGLLILDECQLIFNARKWEKNEQWIRFFTQSRKLGWNVILIAHTIDMIDSQIRPLCEYESRFRNMQRIKVPLIGCPLSPFPLFLKIQRYAGLGPGASAVSDRDMFPLPLWAAKLYDSLETFNIDDWGKATDAELCGSAPRPDRGTVPAERQRLGSVESCLWSSWDRAELLRLSCKAQSEA